MHRLFAPSLLVATLAASSIPSYSAAESCGCMDLADLKHRREEVRVALNVYQSEIERVNGEMIKNRKPIYYTPALAQGIKDKVQAALNQNAAGKLATAASGGTDNLCNVNANERATSCMQQSTQAHEQVHQDRCLQTQGPSTVLDSISTPGQFKDRFEVNHAPLISNAIEETNAYFAEQNFLEAQIKALEGPCTPRPQIQRDYSSQADNQSSDSPGSRQAHRPASPAPDQQVKGAVNSLRRMFGR
jgi:hypothetical protein